MKLITIAGPVCARPAGQGEDAGADHHADAEDGQVERGQRLLELVLRFVGVGDRLLDRLGAEHTSSEPPRVGHAQSGPGATLVAGTTTYCVGRRAGTRFAASRNRGSSLCGFAGPVGRRDVGGASAVRMFVVPGLIRDLGVTLDAVVGDPGVRRDDESAGMTVGCVPFVCSSSRA
ncbi:MAG: hypothetical protein R2719_08750 [Micropruina sp.]